MAEKNPKGDHKPKKRIAKKSKRVRTSTLLEEPNSKKTKITAERRNKIRTFLQRQSAKTGRHWADLLAQSLNTDEVMSRLASNQ